VRTVLAQRHLYRGECSKLPSLATTLSLWPGDDDISITSLLYRGESVNTCSISHWKLCFLSDLATTISAQNRPSTAESAPTLTAFDESVAPKMAGGYTGGSYPPGITLNDTPDEANHMWSDEDLMLQMAKSRRRSS
jgi:hypothetical protein